MKSNGSELSTLGSGETAFEPFSARLQSSWRFHIGNRPAPYTRRYSPGLAAEQTEPEKTTHAPLTAWIAGDRNTALKLAEPAAVDKLFSGPSLKVNAKELAYHPIGKGQRLPD